MTHHPSRVVGIFPTPVLHAPTVISADQAMALRESLIQRVEQTNAKSELLAHTEILHPEHNPLLVALTDAVIPRVTEFGELIFGERLNWCVKEMWLNVLQQGGHQAFHSHANSFVSGVIYLTQTEADSSLTFLKGMGHPAFVFKNTHSKAASGPFNSDKWVMPKVQVGDLVLFPSYMLHEVPINRGATRISLAFNAIPHRLDAWGYQIGFNSSQSFN